MEGSSGMGRDDVSSSSGMGPRNGAGVSNWDSSTSSVKSLSPTTGSAPTSEASISVIQAEGTGTKSDKKEGKRRGTELTAVVKPRALNPKLWPELEIAVESEVDYQGEGSGGLENGLGDVSALLEQYGRRVEKKREFSEEDLKEAEAGMRDMTGDKKQWAAFEARLASAPEQVIRYCRSACAKPLWPTTSHQPSKGSIPPCPGCGSERIFEFQVLPQVLYYMQVDSSDPETLDWGTIAVYTCSKSCSGGTDAYREECVWVQIPQ
jgi:pre-rRNA-processing protein TSR4